MAAKKKTHSKKPVHHYAGRSAGAKAVPKAKKAAKSVGKAAVKHPVATYLAVGAGYTLTGL